MNTRLWYQAPARSFREALPIGNGSLGAMVFGGYPGEKLLINSDTFWSGRPVPVEQKDLTHLEMARNLILNKKYREAEQVVEQHLLGHYNESYMPLGILHIDYPYEGKVHSYKRELDLEQAVHRTTFAIGQKQVTSEVFCSTPHRSLIMNISTDQAGGLSAVIRLESKVQYHVSAQGSDTLIMKCTAPSHVAPNYVQDPRPVRYDPEYPGMKGMAVLRVRCRGGRVEPEGNALRISGADGVQLLFTCTTGYRGFGKAFQEDTGVLERECREQLDKMLQKSYEELLGIHTRDYSQLYRRVEFELDEPVPHLPTDERLERFRRGEQDISLPVLLFHYSRYLLIASSRKGSQPANLQGIWSDSIRPVWSSNWTININTQMNYWLTGPCNLEECQQPLQQMVTELMESGRETAEKYYGCRGWAANHNVDIWRQTVPAAGLARYAYWPMGGVWLANQLYQHYRYYRSAVYLEEIWEILEESVRFCLDWMIQDERGYYITVPSISPENEFLDDEREACAVSAASTMDISLIRELLENYLEAARERGRAGLLEEEVREHLAHLPPLQLNARGELKEWQHDFEECDPGHRHFSPLVGLHPGRLIDKYDNPELAAGCEKLLERRLTHGGGHIGWSCIWLVLFYARLKKGDSAGDFLKQFLQNSTYDNLFDLHPPLGEGNGEREVFQIDANLGSAAAIAELLMQSRGGEVELLPALPSEWKNGCVKGLRGEGGFEVSIWWKENRLVRAEIRAHKRNMLRIRYRGKIRIKKPIEKGKVFVFTPDTAK